MIRPLFLILEKTISLRSQPGKGYSSALADRALYDDVNEFFWQRENVDVLLGGHRVLRSPGKAYMALRKSLTQRESALLALFRKTFYERPTWLSVFHTFQRYITLNAVAIHIMTVVSITHAICDAETEATMPDLSMVTERLSSYNECLITKRGGGFGWRSISTFTVTHSALQIIADSRIVLGRAEHITRVVLLVWLLRDQTRLVQSELQYDRPPHKMRVRRCPSDTLLDPLLSARGAAVTAIDYFHIVAIIYSLLLYVSGRCFSCRCRFQATVTVGAASLRRQHALQSPPPDSTFRLGRDIGSQVVVRVLRRHPTRSLYH